MGLCITKTTFLDSSTHIKKIDQANEKFSARPPRPPFLSASKPCDIFKALLLERDIAQHERKHLAEDKKREAYLALVGNTQQLID